MFRQINQAILLCAVFVVVNCFPDGGPADTCVKPERFNQPNHGQARSQPIGSLPYEVIATTDQYQPGQQIQSTVLHYAMQNASITHQFFLLLNTVTIRGRDYFRGFFIQARDTETNEWIGSWQDSQNTKTIPECASITHADNKDKEGANLIWNAPQHKSGRVYFTGSVVKNYSTFWADVVAKIPIYQR
ncbi:putative defense protein 3 isoform X1 [Contarinia nasturtii]|uniref:putative defense protein 3 isoform X1 n=1 Tax=Contarinia nasturtii TaxID=265458 RepID=UPI0012D40460|nr:putative defense protein 3 isoform X1 [Contarinia nasturtii]